MKSLRTRLALVLILSSSMVTISAVLISRMLFALFLPRQMLLAGFAISELLSPGLTMAVFCAGGYVFSKRLVRPIENLSNATQEIARGNFDVAIPASKRRDEVGELERNFSLMAKELKSNEYLRRDFIANVSHEFRTPLSVMQGYAQLLAAPGPMSEEERIYAALLIEKESQRLLNLSSNMLRISKLNSQSILPSPSRFPLDEQLRCCVLRLESAWEKKGLSLTLKLAPLSMTADEDLLSQVWQNLLENAIKFTPSGGEIRLTLTVREDYACVTFEDTGIGMDKNTLARIFEQFYQGDSSHANEGSGLGLPLAKRIVELHGGRLLAESEPGCGSRFMVLLPLKR